MPESRRIVIYGCGALGSLFAGLLAAAGHQVLAVCRNEQQREAIRQRGLQLLEKENQRQVPFQACAELPAGERYDLVIVLVKSFDTEAAAQILAERLSPQSPVLTLQNGLGNAEALAARLQPGQVLAGVTTFGALQEAPGVVRLTGRGECEIGAWDRAAELHLRAAAQLLTGSGLPCSISPNIGAALWKKLAVNAVINPLTALLRVPNGELLQHEELQNLFAVIVEEVWHVAARCRVGLPMPPELVAEVRRVCQLTAANRSSMFRDVEQGRPTEIDAINGAVVRLGRERGVLTQANLTLASLIQTLSQHVAK